MYFLAIDTTSLRFDSVSLSLAFFSAFSYLLASSISSSAESRGTLPISLKYCLTGSVDSAPPSLVRISISRSSFSCSFSPPSASSGVTDSNTSTFSVMSFP
ncbi:hypothetical protein A2V56_02495 [Candidatus Woesebacteria bacterium RBG_19FT_COMBO_42_9]|nr:MAG: hypothetical protein A2V56_02495 [Candidatus Woesebacteria bacterium RBG_19FT_COMBO_42_9]